MSAPPSASPPSTAPPRTPPPRTQQPRPTSTAGGSLVPATVAGVAVVLCSTALAGLIDGLFWLAYPVVVVVVVAAAGAGLRSLGIPTALVPFGQLVAVSALLTTVFTRSGILVVLPGPAALGELRLVLQRAAEQVQTGVPPVAVSAELLCLVVLTIGIVAVLVDALAVDAGAPAAAGLVLLCVFAVPASLADDLLPWWSFVAGAAGFALLLTVDGRRRHLVWGRPSGPGGNAGAAPAAVAVGATSLVVALVAGAVLTVVGTEGRLPGGGGGTGGGSAGIGLNTFTSLRGQLDDDRVVDLFRVRGLPERGYLRALTLSEYRNEVGWQLSARADQGPADGDLPLPPGTDSPVAGTTFEVEIEPLNYVDNWLPAFGIPLSFENISSDWRFDPSSLTIFSDLRMQADTYVQTGVLPAPTADTLRSDAPPTAIGPEFLDTGGVDERVAALAREVTADADTAFDRTVALNRFFTTAGNGFSYELETTPGSTGDALVDFLFETRSGFCEQYASAMAIMLRTLGIPARVALGFTPGVRTGDAQLITTQDAHAWVEAYFPGAGWLTFDPTPLSDGRAIVPPYVAEVPQTPTGGPEPTEEQIPGAPTSVRAPSDAASAPTQGPGSAGGAGDVLRVVGVAVVVALLLAALVCAPAAIRALRRRRRWTVIEAGGPDAAETAWAEVLAESTDRGARVAGDSTVRATARALVDAHRLDEPGQDGLRTLIAAVERAWYGRGGRAPEVAGALTAVVDALRRTDPLGRRERLFPRSVVRDGRAPTRHTEPAEVS